MGSCCSSGDPPSKEMMRSVTIDQDIYRSMMKDASRKEADFKILLLGAGESGKSTLFKQAQIIYNQGFVKKERMLYVPIISINVFEGLLRLIKGAEGDLDGIEEDVQFVLTAEEDIDFLHRINSVAFDHLIRIWRHPTIQEAFSRRSQLNVQDSLRHYCDKLEDISKATYVPSDLDILFCRRATTGAHEKVFVVNRRRIRMIDVGGQRNERRKWIHHFDHCDAVLFVAAISMVRVFTDDPVTNGIQVGIIIGVIV